MATCLTSWKPTQRNRQGEISEGLSGSEDMACMEKSVRNLGEPAVSCTKVTGKPTQSKKRMAKGWQEVGLTHSTPRAGKPLT